ncbi:MAG: HepT-like ribonuclease domain-containing protein [Thermoanaerobaculia bacterium]
MKRDRQRLEDILEAIERIERYASGGRASFDRDELVQTWIVHHLQIIGEAVRGLSDEIRSAHTDVPWAQIAAMRNILVHDYFGIDLEEVWAAVVRDVPTLKTKVAAILGGGA